MTESAVNQITISDDDKAAVREAIDAQFRLAMREISRARTLGNNQAALQWQSYSDRMLSLQDIFQ